MSGLRAKFLFPSFRSFLPILFQLRFCNNCYFEVNLVSSRSCCSRQGLRGDFTVMDITWRNNMQDVFCFMFHWNKRNVLIWVQKTTHGDEYVIMMICVGKAASWKVQIFFYSFFCTRFKHFLFTNPTDFALENHIPIALFVSQIRLAVLW